MSWQWAAVRAAITDSDKQFPSFLAKLPRSEIERLMSSNNHWCNVVMSHLSLQNLRTLEQRSQSSRAIAVRFRCKGDTDQRPQVAA